MELLRRGRRLVNQKLGRDLSYSTQVNCSKKYIGSKYGGYCLCLDKITENSVVYSFGVGDDISFDLSMIEKFGVNVFAFDPTPKSINWLKTQNTPKEFHFFEYGIADYDGTAKFDPPENPKHVSFKMIDRSTTVKNAIDCKVYKLKSILNMMNHKKIDVLKMDIEGAEYAVINDLIVSDTEIHQLLIEFHHRFKHIGILETKRAIQSLNEKGFRIFYISPTGEEYSFINRTS